MPVLPSSAKAPPSVPASTSPGGAREFARALEGVSATADGGVAEAGTGASPAEREPVSPEQPDASLEHPAAITPAPAAPLPWPPAGLAGLPGITMPVDADAQALAVAAGAAHDPSPAAADTRPVGLVPAAPLPVTPAVPATVAGAPGVASMAAGLDEAAAAIPLPAEAAHADDAAPAPPAFALPAVAGGAPPALREPPPVLATPLPPANVHAEDFGDRFGAQLQWMAGQKIGHARIQVTPHGLGPVEVRLQLDGDHISAEFLSAHVDTRQALEQGLPRLRDLLGEHGFHLAHADVGAQSGSNGRAEERAAMAGDTGDSEPGTGAATPPVARRSMAGLLDAYA
ncbi:hypothetical protein CO641_07115 [Lysobacteraceae bacterium NML91-0213]|nr:hypothetical protein CO641_07115 [Xanthomonadaceae bacterium NML91-0213]